RLLCHSSPLTRLGPLALHAALPISVTRSVTVCGPASCGVESQNNSPLRRSMNMPLGPVTRLNVNASSESVAATKSDDAFTFSLRSEEHTSELQSRRELVCRLLLEKK